MDLFACKCVLLLLSFIGCCAAQDILPEGPVDAIVGKNVTLTTKLDKPDYDFIIWNFNNGEEQINIVTIVQKSPRVNPLYEGRVSLDTDNGHLTIGPLTTEDTGDYSINLLTPDSITRTAEIRLNVLVPVSNIVIKSDLTEAIEHNSTVVLTCSATGSSLKFTWLNGTTPFMADGKRIAVQELGESSSSLTITGVLRTDLVGPIYCTVTNKLEVEKSAPFNLTIYYGPEEVTISPLNPPEFVSSASNFNLSCSAISSPPAELYWDYSEGQLETFGPFLTVEMIGQHGIGKKSNEYTCRAKNTKTGRTVSSAKVSFAIMDPITGAQITGPTTVLLAGNSTANISCSTKAGTVQATKWTKDGQDLAPSDRLEFSDDKTSLKINQLMKEDNGNYMCELTNSVSKASTSYKMVVNYGPETPIVSGEDAVEVNDKVTLTCSADSLPPANFTWKFNGTVMDVKTATYVIEAAAYKNTGMYTCEAHNAVTGMTTTHTHSMCVKAEGTLDPELSDGAIAGIVIGVLVALAAAIGLIMYCRQKVPVESPY